MHLEKDCENFLKLKLDEYLFPNEDDGSLYETRVAAFCDDMTSFLDPAPDQTMFSIANQDKLRSYLKKFVEENYLDAFVYRRLLYPL